MKKIESLNAKTREEAWKMAAEVFGCDWEKDEGASNGAGYPIYKGTSDAQCWISDLNCRLELNMADGSTINIWIEEPVQKFTAREVKDIITHGRAELCEIEAMIQFVGNQTGDTAMDILHTLKNRQDWYKRQLAQFGL